MSIKSTAQAAGPSLIDIQAMSLEVPDTPGHPNKHPFSGILTRIDEPSDAPPHGTGDRLVLVTKACAEAALSTLLGMAVDSMPNLAGHAATRKIGVITQATIEGNAIHIGGFFYASDFPAELQRIVQLKSKLGFSFELSPTSFEITTDNIYQVNSGHFTGAALLFKDKAAYQTTSLAAAAQSQEIDAMTKEEMQALLAETMKPITDQVTDLGTKVAKLSAAGSALEANAQTMSRVEPHAAGLESCAASMEAAGVGLEPRNGHVQMLRRMAGSMRAEAAMGKIPHVYRDHSYFMEASAAPPTAENPETTKKLEAAEASMKELKDSLAAATTQIADLRAGKRQEATPPERKTTPTADLTKLLSRFGLSSHVGTDGAPDMHAISAALAKQGLTPAKRMEIKMDIERFTQEGAAAA